MVSIPNASSESSFTRRTWHQEKCETIIFFKRVPKRGISLVFTYFLSHKQRLRLLDYCVRQIIVCLPEFPMASVRQQFLVFGSCLSKILSIPKTVKPLDFEAILNWNNPSINLDFQLPIGCRAGGGGAGGEFRPLVVSVKTWPSVTVHKKD